LGQKSVAGASLPDIGSRDPGNNGKKRFLFKQWEELRQLELVA